MCGLTDPGRCQGELCFAGATAKDRQSYLPSLLRQDAMHPARRGTHQQTLPVPTSGWRSVHRGSRRSGCGGAMVARRSARAKELGQRAARPGLRSDRVLEALGLGPDDWYVGLHVREGGCMATEQERSHRTDPPTLRTTNSQSKKLPKPEGGFSGLAIPRCGRSRPCLASSTTPEAGSDRREWTYFCLPPAASLSEQRRA